MTTVNIKTDYLAEGDGQEVTATLSITSGTKTLTADTNLWDSGDVGKTIFVAGAGEAGVAGPSEPGTPFVLRSTIQGPITGPTNTITLADNATRTLTTSSQLVAWATNDYQAFADFNGDFQGQTGVVLNIPASSGFYAIWSAGDAGSGFSSGIKQIHVLGDNGSSRPVIRVDAAGSHVAALGIGSNFSFRGPGFDQVQPLVNTVTAGNNYVTCITPAEAAGFSAGDWVGLNACETMGFGYPPNPAFFEYLEVASSDAGTGVVTFTSNIVDSHYLSTYPYYEMGFLTPFGGPANILRCGADAPTATNPWDTECTFESLEITGTHYQLNTIGRDIRIIDCTIGQVMNPTTCKSVTITNNTWLSSAEFDKFNETVTIDGGDYHYLDFQSGSSGKTTTLSNLHADQIGPVGGTPESITINNCTIDTLKMGCLGRCLSVMVTDSVIGDVVAADYYVDGVTGTYAAPMSGGVITATSIHDTWSRDVVPGTAVFMCAKVSSPVVGPAFQITSQSSPSNPMGSGDSLVIGTSLAGDWPPIPATTFYSTPLEPSLMRVWVPSITFTNTSGCVIADDLSNATPGLPFRSYLKRTYNRTTLTGLSNVFNIIGEVLSITVNVITPHDGSGGVSTLWFQPFSSAADETFVLGGATPTFSLYNPRFDLMTAGTRVITPSGVTGNVGADSLSGTWGLTFPEPYIWAWDTTRSAISSDVSGTSSPLSYWWEIITDQGVVSSGTIPTTTAVVSSLNPSTLSSLVTFTATVTPDSGVLVPTGTVTFYDVVTSLGTGALNGSGVATLATSALAVGSHNITASYGGDINFSASVSSVLVEVITGGGTGPGGMVVFTTMM